MMKGKVVIITGGSRGIGRACVLAFGKNSANVVYTYNKSKSAVDTLNSELDNMDVRYLSLQADVRDYNSVKDVVKKTLDEFGHIDVVVNNAGITRDKALVMMTLDDWRDVIEVNLGGVFNMSRAVITTLLKQKSGCIINISSVSGLVGIPRQTNYCASKAGIIGFSRALAKEVAAYNIRVNAICPGYIDTDMVASLRDDIKENVVNMVPMKRLGDPQEVAEYCLFLASDKAKYITGSIAVIDGGLIS